MKVTVLLNPSAGVAARSPPGELEGRVAALFRARGVRAEILAVAPWGLEAQVRRALGAGVDAVVVGGGDGTVGAAAGVLAGGDTPLGVLPLGTFNNFARDLGMPLEPEAAVAAIARGGARAIDVGEVNGRIFVNNSSIGLYPEALAGREARRRRGAGKWRAMAAASLGVLLRYPLLRVRLEADGRRLERTTPFVFVGNNRYDFGVLGARRRRLDEGALFAYVAGRRSRTGLLLLAQRALAGRLEQARDLEQLRVSGLRVELPAEAVRVAFDGESALLNPPLRYRVRPGALRVLGGGLQASGPRLQASGKANPAWTSAPESLT